MTRLISWVSLKINKTTKKKCREQNLKNEPNVGGHPVSSFCFLFRWDFHCTGNLYITVFQCPDATSITRLSRAVSLYVSHSAYLTTRSLGNLPIDLSMCTKTGMIETSWLPPENHFICGKVTINSTNLSRSSLKLSTLLRVQVGCYYEHEISGVFRLSMNLANISHEKV